MTWNSLGMVFLGFSWVKSQSLIHRSRKSQCTIALPSRDLGRRREGGFQWGGAGAQPGQFCLWDIFIPWNSAIQTGVSPMFPWLPKCCHVLSLALLLKTFLAQLPGWAHSEAWAGARDREDHRMFSSMCHWSCVFRARFRLLMQIAQHNLGWVWGNVFHTCW